MSKIDLTTFVSALGALGRAPKTALVAFTPWAGSAPAAQVVDGGIVVVPDGIRVQLVDGVPEEDIIIAPNTGQFCYRVSIATADPNFKLIRYVSVPDFDVDFEDLVDVDPDTFLPSASATAGWLAAIEAFEALIAGGGGIPGPAGPSAYEIAVDEGFVGTEAQWLESLEGAPGDDGREVQLQKSATHIQWRYEGDVVWVDLVALADLKGADGDDGDDGREVELRSSGTAIEWRYVGDPGWTSLVLLSALKGDPGDPGIPGASAYEVAVAEGFVGDEAAWLASLVGADGTDATLTTYADMAAVDALETTQLGKLAVADYAEFNDSGNFSWLVGQSGVVVFETQLSVDTPHATEGVAQRAYVYDPWNQVGVVLLRTRVRTIGAPTWGAWTDWYDAQPFASSTSFGVTRYSSNAETQAMTSFTRAVTPASLASAASSAATANRLMRRDSNGRAKVAAPSATDDVARLDTVTAAVAALQVVISLVPGSAAGPPLGIDAWANTGWGLLTLSSTSPYAFLGSLPAWADLNVNNTTLPVRAVTAYKDLGGGSFAGTHEQRVYGVNDAGAPVEAVRKRDYTGSWGAWGAWTNVPSPAPLDSPAFTGTPTVPNVTAGDNTTKAANTAFVTAAVAAGGGGGGIPIGPSPKTSGQVLTPQLSNSVSSGQTNYATGSVYPMPIPVPEPGFPCDGVYMRVVTAENGINTRALVYSSDADGWPLDLVATGTVTTGSGNNVDYVAAFPAVDLPPGLYWVFLRSDGGNTIRYSGVAGHVVASISVGVGPWDTSRAPSMRADPGTYASPNATLSGHNPTAVSTSSLPYVGLRRA